MSATESADEILNSAKKLLQNQVFSGRYKERRLIDIGKDPMYKDVVIVDKSEQDFMKTLKAVNDILINHFEENIITCIAGTQTNLGASCTYSIFTNLDGVTLGNHWFQVKSVSLCNDIFHITLKSLRPLKNVNNANSANFPEYISNFNLDSFKIWLLTFLECLRVENIVNFSRFLAVLILTFFVGCYHLLELLLRGVKEVNVFVHNITPVLIACVDGVTKIFGGLFILIAMMWNSWMRKDASHYPQSPAYLGNNRNYPMSLEYPMGIKSRTMYGSKLRTK